MLDKNTVDISLVGLIIFLVLTSVVVCGLLIGAPILIGWIINAMITFMKVLLLGL